MSLDLAWAVTAMMALIGLSLLLAYHDPFNRRHMCLRLLGCCLLIGAPWALAAL